MIVVTGLMRSGTSPIAQMIHQMGIPMGTHMRFPLPGQLSHLEWEDEPLSSTLARRLQGEMNGMGIRKLLELYISGREKVHGNVWGVKSPFLLPYIDEWKIAAEGLGHECIVVSTTRDYDDTVTSLRAQMEHLPDGMREKAAQPLLSLQAKLAQSTGGLSANCTIDIGDTWAQPHAVAARLCRVMGVDADIDAATRGIGRRGTEWA